VAANDATAQQAKGPSLPIQLAVLAVMTMAAVGTGWLAASMIGGNQTAAPQEPAARAAEIATRDMPTDVGIVHLEPITTNLGTPADMWIRLEMSLVFNSEPDVEMAEVIHQDLLAYLRTVKVHQIQGASGFQHLKADLSERASIRSEGAVREILIRTMILE
jgi:flagellar protein FliL